MTTVQETATVIVRKLSAYTDNGSGVMLCYLPGGSTLQWAGRFAVPDNTCLLCNICKTYHLLR